MNTNPSSPDVLIDLQESIQNTYRNGGKLTIAGGRSKIQPVENGDLQISTSRLSGIVDHQATDFTITLLSGTPVAQVVECLHAAGQHLPFDPVRLKAGATIGGTVATGLNGPCCFRFGGIRDFIIGCQFIDGTGNLIRSGGKVVKNAAGFDLPKFMVGSLGRFGLMTEITFKVFPEPRMFQTLVVELDSIDIAVRTIQALLDLRLELDAIVLDAANRILIRNSGENEKTLDEQAGRLKTSLSIDGKTLRDTTEREFWKNRAEWADVPRFKYVLKVPITLTQLPGFDDAISRLGITRTYNSAGNVAMLFLETREELGLIDKLLTSHQLTGQIVIGHSDLFLFGASPTLGFLQKVKSALDPGNVFGSIHSAIGEPS